MESEEEPVSSTDTAKEVTSDNSTDKDNEDPMN
jgi:hypothetical protein